MKRFSTVLVLTFLVTVSIAVAAPDLGVKATSTDPTPLTPGQTATVYVTLQNTADDRAEGIEIVYEGHRYFELLQPGDERRTVRLLGGQEDITLAYEVAIPDDAHTGTFSLPFTIKAANAQATLQKDVSVTIKPDRPTLQVTGVTTTPKPLPPGQQGSIALTLENEGERALSDIDVSMDVTDTPFLAVGQTNVKRYDELLSGDTETVTFQVTTEPSTTSNVYKLPFTLTYDDESGETTDKTVSTGITVGGDAELLVTLSSIDLSTTQRTGDISLNVVNKGLADVKLLHARLKDHDSYSLRGTDSYYIGNIESDDFDVITFTAEAQNNTLTVPVELTYRTAFNEERTTTRTVTYTLPQGSNETSYTPYIIVLLIIAGLIWWYKRRR